MDRLGIRAEDDPIRRSLLFVPAVRPDRYPKALATGADAVCIDLEDGVALEAKDSARGQALNILANRSLTRAEVSLRINDVKTTLGQTDLAELVNSGVRPDALMLPKVSGEDEIKHVESVLASRSETVPLIVQIETARGLSAATEIAGASSNISALFFGAIDLSSDLGCAVEWEALLYARSQVVLAASLAGISALDSPFMNVQSVDALAEESRQVRRLGFVGKAAIHPSQVSVIQQSFSPSVEEILWAKKIVAAYEQQQGGVLLVSGQLIERPVIRTARRMLSTASRLGDKQRS